MSVPLLYKPVKIKNPNTNEYNYIENIYAFGDEQTDEHMFEVLDQEKHYTFKVGKKSSRAKFRCNNYKKVFEILEMINEGLDINQVIEQSNIEVLYI